MDVIIVYANAILCIKVVVQATAGSKGPGPSKHPSEAAMETQIAE